MLEQLAARTPEYDTFTEEAERRFREHGPDDARPRADLLALRQRRQLARLSSQPEVEHPHAQPPARAAARGETTDPSRVREVHRAVDSS